MSVALKQTTRSPRVWRTHLPAYACRIYVTAFRARIGLCIYWPAHPTAPPLSASCSSGQRFAFSFLQIPPRDGHPCCSANTSPCRVCRGLSPPSECALPGAHRVGGGVAPAVLPHHPPCGSATGGSCLLGRDDLRQRVWFRASYRRALKSTPNVFGTSGPAEQFVGSHISMGLLQHASRVRVTIHS